MSRLVAEREGVALMPELGYGPVNRYLPPRPRRGGNGRDDGDADSTPTSGIAHSLQRWLGRALRR